MKQPRHQPLLVSLPTERDKRRGDLHNVMLIPELCLMTGLSKKMRDNFNFMAKLAEHTRKGPAERVSDVRSFLTRLRRTREARGVANSWNLEFGRDLVCIK